MGYPRWLSGKGSAYNAGDAGLDPWEEVATHSSILAGGLHGQRSLADCSPRGHTEQDKTERLGLSDVQRQMLVHLL